MQDSKYKSCQDQDFSRLKIFRDVETKNLQDQEIWRVLRPRPVVTEQKLLRLRLFDDKSEKGFAKWCDRWFPKWYDKLCYKWFDTWLTKWVTSDMTLSLKNNVSSDITS